MNGLDLLRVHALVGIPLGLAVGLALGLVARRADGWGGYASLRRRAARLGHVALVMLPALGGVYALMLEETSASRAALAWGAWLWVAGGTCLPAALFATAWSPRWMVALPLPALATFAGAATFAVAGLGG